MKTHRALCGQIRDVDGAFVENARVRLTQAQETIIDKPRTCETRSMPVPGLPASMAIQVSPGDRARHGKSRKFKDLAHGGCTMAKMPVPPRFYWANCRISV